MKQLSDSLQEPQPDEIPPAEEQGSITVSDLLSNVAIVLVEPKYPENIGAAARSAMNMGISRLIVVRQEPPDQQKMLKMATHHAAHLIERMELYAEFDKALASFSWVVGTTARQGRHRRSIKTPRQMVDQVLPLVKNNKVALLFGSEDRGLTNDHLKLCNLITSIPTTTFSSLNLAQAVAIHCYELYYGFHEAQGMGKRQSVPKLAETRELESMYEHVEQMLRHIGFLKPNDQQYWMRTIRQFLGRIGLRSKEARIIRGFCRQFIWYDTEESQEKKKS